MKHKLNTKETKTFPILTPIFNKYVLRKYVSFKNTNKNTLRYIVYEPINI